MNQKIRYTRTEVEHIGARIDAMIDEENERMTSDQVLADITDKIRKLRDCGFKRKQIAEALREAGLQVSSTELAACLSGIGPQAVRTKRTYRSRKSASVNPKPASISPGTDMDSGTQMTGNPSGGEHEAED